MTSDPSSAVSPRVYAAVILGVFVVAAGLFAHWLLRDNERLVGTNSATPATYVFPTPKGQTVCLRDLTVPAHADQLQLDLFPLPNSKPTRVSVAVRTDAGYSGSSSRVLSPAGGAVRFPIPRNPAASPGTVCAKVSEYVSVAGSPGLPADGRVQAFVDHKPQTGGRASLWFVDSRKRSLLSLLPTAAHRSSVFRAGFVGPWVYLLALLVLPLMWWLGLRRLVRARA